MGLASVPFLCFCSFCTFHVLSVLLTANSFFFSMVVGSSASARVFNQCTEIFLNFLFVRVPIKNIPSKRNSFDFFSFVNVM